jgi:DNA polymerase-3 subunit chi
MARSHQEAPVVRFYQLAAMPLEMALLSLLGKSWQQGIRSCVWVRDTQQAQRLDEQLWSMPPPQQFIPHGLWSGAEAARQPILLAVEPLDVNRATLLVVLTAQVVEKPEQFDMVIDFVAGAEAAGLRASRQRYRHYRTLGCRLEYWLQGEQGGWQKQETSVKEDPK